MNHINAQNIIFELCFCDSKTDIAIYNNYSWASLAYRFCNAIDSKIPITPPTESKGYIITNYLPPDSATYEGVNINKNLGVFQRSYVLREE